MTEPARGEPSDRTSESVPARRCRTAATWASGTIGVIVPEADVTAVRERLARTEADVRGLGSPRPGSVTVLTGADAKGLEFDGVLLVDPDRVGSDAARAAAAVYVAMTRPTRRLTVIDVA